MGMATFHGIALRRKGPFRRSTSGLWFRKRRIFCLDAKGFGTTGKLWSTIAGMPLIGFAWNNDRGTTIGTLFGQSLAE